MPAVIIPFDYDEKSHSSVVPICINDTDANGNLIYRGWIEQGVIPAADRLRRAAKDILKDVWRVSEIADYAVHSIWAHRGFNLGVDPHVRVAIRASWYAEDLAVGGRRIRRGADLQLFEETLELLRDQFDLVADVENRDRLEKLVAQANALGMHDAVAMVPMMLRACSAEEYVKRFGKKRNTLAQMFFRNMRRAAQVAGCPGGSSLKTVEYDCNNVKDRCALKNRPRSSTNGFNGVFRRRF